MLRNLPALFLSLILGACVNMPTSNVPNGYQGPFAVISDSVTPRAATTSDIFYLSAIDGLRIKDSLIATREGNAGRGRYLYTTMIDRPVLAQAGTFKVFGRTAYGAPFDEITHTVYQVSGDVRFTPQPSGHYVVRGILGADYSAVWIEDAESRTVMGEKIEIKGSAKLGVFEK